MTLDKESPHNWIAEIAGCDLNLSFKALYQVLKRDVDIANNLPAKKRRNYRFRLERNGEGTSPTIRITRRQESPLTEDYEAVVQFDMYENAVRLESPLLKDRLTMIYPQWDNESSSCKLYINDKHVKVWEISKLALQPTIFG